MNPGSVVIGFLLFQAGPWILAYAIIFFFSRGWLRTSLKILGAFCICSAMSFMYWRSQWLKDMPDHSVINDPTRAPAYSSVVAAAIIGCLIVAGQALFIARTKGHKRWWALAISVPLTAFLFQYIDQAQEMYGVFTGGRR
jgi:hypothetical protein